MEALFQILWEALPDTLIRGLQKPDLTPPLPVTCNRQKLLFSEFKADPADIDRQQQSQNASRLQLTGLRDKSLALLLPSHHLQLTLIPKKGSPLEVSTPIAPLGPWHQKSIPVYSSLIHFIVPPEGTHPQAISPKNAGVLDNRALWMEAIRDACRNGQIETRHLMRGLQALIGFHRLEPFTPSSTNIVTSPPALEGLETLK